MKKNKRVLVTGGAGFIGAHLCRSLLEYGYEVIALDNLVSGRTENLKEIFYHENFTFHEHDVTEFIHIHGELDWVLHLASLASPIFYKENPIKTLKVGALGTHKALGLAKQKNAKFLFTSTSEVYGDPEVSPQPETYRGNVDPIGPRSCYDESKRYGESIIKAYKDKHNLEVRIARIFNTYGPKMRKDDGRVIPTFITQALNNKNLTIHGKGTQTRSFCYIKDMVDGLRKLMNNDVQKPVNLGSTNEITIKELAKRIIEITNTNSEITHEPRPPQDPNQRKPDITKAKKELNWKPKTKLKKGLQKTIKYLKERDQK